MSVKLFAVKIADGEQINWRFVFARSKVDAASKLMSENPGLVPIAVYEPVVLGEETSMSKDRRTEDSVRLS